MTLPELPELHLADWRPTKDTLHLYCQIVGKVRLATAPPRNHWWNAPLYADVRGLTTRRLHHNGTTFQIDFDFVDHSLLVRTHDGRVRSFDLAEGVPVADFDGRLHAALSELGVDVEIKEHPFGVPMTTPFPEDREHAAWDRAAIESYGRILDWTDRVFEEFSGWFSGKTSPVHLFWHSLDLAVTRFSGRPAPPIAADAVTQEAYSQELISFGFWAGDDNSPDAAYYTATPDVQNQSGIGSIDTFAWVPGPGWRVTSVLGTSRGVCTASDGAIACNGKVSAPTRCTCLPGGKMTIRFRMRGPRTPPRSAQGGTYVVGTAGGYLVVKTVTLVHRHIPTALPSPSE